MHELICSPMIMPPSLYLTFSLNLVCNITWLILWDREYMPAGLGVIVLLLLTLIACVVISYRAVLVNMPALIRYKLTKEVTTVHWFKPCWISLINNHRAYKALF